MEVEACYNYDFLPAGRHQIPPPYGPPPPHTTEDGELWEYFPCPFCYIEVEVPFICNHLQEEHCFDTRNAVCPICANNLGKDIAAHFRVEHSHLLKRRKPPRRPAAAAAAGANNNMEEEPPQQHYTYRLSSSIGIGIAPDPLLSHFICSSIAIAQVQDPAVASTPADDDDNKLGLEERLQRIEFLSEILMSTIL